MGKSLFGANAREANGEIDQIAIDYKLKLIAFQDELFQSRKKLQESDKRMADLQKKLEEYVHNKENQIAEVMFTAHMNAQRIEAQTRSQTDYFILEMEDEMRRKQKELELLQKKTNRFANDTQADNVGDQDNAARLQIVQDNIRAFKEQIETTKITDASPDNKKSATIAKIAKIADLPLDNRDQNTKNKIDRSLESKEQGAKAKKVNQSLEIKEQDVEIKVIEQPLVNKKRRVVVRKSDKPKINKDEIATTEVIEGPVLVQDQLAAKNIIDNSQENSIHAAPQDYSSDYQPVQTPQVEPNERMRLDAFVDARYYEIIAGQKQMQHHALQVTIEVEVPPDNYSVRYTKVSSDVVSNLLKFDNVVLNEVFPFNFIEPNPQNIAMYFYNCLEDMLSLMDLELHCLTVLALPDIQIQVNSRNIKLDNFLHQGDNVLDNIRESLIPCVETESDDSSPLKGTLNRLLKKRN